MSLFYIRLLSTCSLQLAQAVTTRDAQILLGLSLSQRTVQVPSFGNPGVCDFGPPSQPAAIIAVA